MAQTELTIHIDDDLKTSGEALFHSKGVTFSAAINFLVRKAVQSEIQLEIDEQENPLFSKETYEMDPYYDRETQADLRKQMAEIESGEAELIDYDRKVE
jgi:antitoxin component of RelBE/YafQ-DinJ toxin-antitoxin module